jgi:hypothetical protein
MKQGFARLPACAKQLTVLMASSVLALVFLCATRTEATTIAIVWAREQVILAADSKTVGMRQSGHSVNYTTCKIRQVDNLFFAASGVITAPSFNIDQIAEHSLSRNGSVLERVGQLHSALLQELPKVIKQNPPGELPISFQYVVVGTENRQPVVHLIYLPAGSRSVADLKWLSFPKDVPLDKSTVTLFLGRHEVIDRFRSKHPGWEFNGVIFERLRELIGMEIRAAPQLIGEPIDVLLVDNAGTRWIERSPESKCPDLR